MHHGGQLDTRTTEGIAQPTANDLVPDADDHRVVACPAQLHGLVEPDAHHRSTRVPFAAKLGSVVDEADHLQALRDGRVGHDCPVPRCAVHQQSHAVLLARGTVG